MSPSLVIRKNSIEEFGWKFKASPASVIARRQSRHGCKQPPPTKQSSRHSGSLPATLLSRLKAALAMTEMFGLR
jgi:hypothetical protein